MKRVVQIARELGVSVSKINEYLKNINIEPVNINTKIDNETLHLIYLAHNDRADQHVGKVESADSTDKLIEIFSYVNPFEKEQFDIINEENTFKNRISIVKEFDGLQISTVFSDFEAFSICNGLEDNFSRALARRFFCLTTKKSSEFYEAHNIAMTALNKYGPEMLSFVICLPPLPFKAIDATQIFNELDKRKTNQVFPLIRISYKNDKNITEKLVISFYSEKKEGNRQRFNNILVIKNKTTGKRLFKISRNGLIIPDSDAKQIKPILQLFVRFSQDTKKFILNYGLETGECSICGRELTDSLSIRRGIGPSCYNNLYLSDKNL